MKKLICILIAFVTLLSLYACDDEILSSTTTTQTAAVTTTIAPTTTVTTTDELTTETTVPTTATTTLPTTTVSTTRFSTVTQSNLHAPIEPSIFDDAIFVGDSVTNNLRLYLNRQNNSGKYPLGKAKLLCAASLSYTNALWSIDRKGNVHPTYNGEKVRVPDGVAKSGAKKVFIMLGMNDFIIYGTDITVKNAITLINQILEKNPDVTIYVQSVTPILKENESGNKTNANVRKLNAKLQQMCADYGWYYLDVASVLVDSYGNLSSAYCIDPGVNGMGIHINDYACRKWIEYLCSNVIVPEPEPPTTTTTTATTTHTTTKTTQTTAITTEITTTLPDETTTVTTRENNV